jgi:long-chain acyl-CoA synthetase
LATPFEGENIDTLLKALRRNCEKIPNSDFLGTRKGDIYEWATYKDVQDMAENLSYGFMELGLSPDCNFDGDSKIWRFIGIQSKNRQEWVITNLANMHNKITTVALYDTLG